MGSTADLAQHIAARGKKLVRLGTVTATDVAGSPPTISVDGRKMRYLASLSAPAVGDVVVWLSNGATPVAIGKLA